jgi:hypothetical protein
LPPDAALVPVLDFAAGCSSSAAQAVKLNGIASNKSTAGSIFLEFIDSSFGLCFSD